MTKTPRIDYQSSMEEIEREALWIVDLIETQQEKITQDSLFLQKAINDTAENENLKILIVDKNGRVVFKPKHAPEMQINIHKIIQQSINIKRNKYMDENFENGKQQFHSIYPVTINDQDEYVVVSGVINGRSSFSATSGWEPIPLFFALIAFIFLFYLLTRKKIKYLKELTEGLWTISKGDLAFRVEPKSKDELGVFANTINHMAGELQTKIERERQLEKTKSVLITNVSHDLRTPLTSMIGYLKLVIDKKYKNINQMESYIQIAYGQTDKLKMLVEDLFEYTKLTDNNTILEKQKICLNELLEQLIEELVPVCTENDIVMVKELYKEKVFMLADPDKLVRVFENLLTNALRYSQKPGEIKVRLVKEENSIIISIHNNGEVIPEEDLPRIFNRFYRVEKSRTASQGGSGLGLAISKSIIDLHGGHIWAESSTCETKFSVQFNIVDLKTEIRTTENSFT